MERFFKNLKENENGISPKIFNLWLLLKEGISTRSTEDRQVMHLFLTKRTFWRNVLKRLIDIVIFLAETNLAFRVSNEILGSPHKGNFFGIIWTTSENRYRLQ